MFTIDDLWRIMKYLKDGTTDPNLSELTTTLATSEKEITNTYFEQIIDQPTFTSNDYRMLRQMIIDWYSSHKTIATTQKYVSDVHQLPNDHLSELFKSFGFPIGLNLVPLSSKANFFLDLVNFYKKKGTPETLVDVLDYYGFSDTDLIEYWLQKDEYGNLIFRGESVRLAAAGSTLLLDSDVPYNKLVDTDPHWFQTKEQILNLVDQRKINLPSKTPYFSLSSIFSLFQITISLSILFRVVEDQYNRQQLNLPLPSNVLVKNLGLVLPLLDVYVGTIYAFERMFGYGSISMIEQFEQYNCYDGPVQYIGDPPVPQNLSDLTSEYEDLISRPTSRLDRDQRLVELINTWSRPLSQNFLNSINAAEPFLEALNPDFKDTIDTWFDTDNQSYLITYLIGTLDNWIRLNIDSKSPSLVITMLGIGFRDELSKIINFFKPYRARLAYMDTAYSIKNPLCESVMLDEWLLTQIEQNTHDAIRPPGGYCEAISQQQIDDINSFDWYALIDEWRWDIGKFFDQPPVAPTPLVEHSILPISGCENLEWWYDIGKKYDIPIPPEYLNFKYDSGGYYDIIPYLQRCLMELVKHHPEGAICDYVDYKIGTFYHDRVGMNRRFDNDWDTGGSFDSGLLEQWSDKCIIEDGKLIHDTIEVEDTFSVDEEISFRDTRIVTDSFYIEISYRGESHSYSNVGRYPVNFDSEGTFDKLTDLMVESPGPVNWDVGGIFDTISQINMYDPNIFEFLSGSVHSTTYIYATDLSGGGIEDFLGYITITTSVDAALVVPGVSESLSSSINISSSSTAEIYSGIVTEILSSSIVTSYAVTSHTLDVGVVELLSGTSYIISNIDVNLTRGLIELLSTSFIGESNVYSSTLDIGIIEQLTSTSLVELNILDPFFVVVNSLYNPKSIIIDMATNHGDSIDMALQGIRFARGGVVYDIGTPGLDYTAYATSTENSGSYAPWRIFFDGTAILTGTVENWASNGATTNQRIICNIGGGILLDEILFYNYHASGTNTDRGIKDIKVYISDDNQSNTTYGSAISNSTLVYEGPISEHTPIDEEDEQSITIGVYTGSSSSTTIVSAQELEFDVISASLDIVSNVIGALVTGENEELTGSSNVITSVDGFVDIGILETLLSGSNIVTTECNAVLSSGSIELLSTLNNITTECDVVLIIGENEILTGTSINIIDVYDNILNVDAAMTSTSISTTEFASLLGVIYILTTSSDTISNIDSNLVTGDNEELTSTIDITTLSTGLVLIGDNEILTGSLDSTTNTFTTILTIGVSEILTSTSTTTSGSVSDLTVV